MPFKPKTNKKIKVEKKSIMTLDKKHNEIISSIHNNENQIPKLKKQIKRLESKLKTLNDIDKIMDAKDKIQDLKQQIKEYKREKTSYYLDNSKHIFNYFEDKKNIINDNNKKKIVNNFFFKNKKPDENASKPENHTKQYLMNVSDEFIDVNEFIVNHSNCQYCSGELVLIEHEGHFICKSCFAHTPFVSDNEKPSYKEPPKEVSSYAYKRINHFREILAQFQAKESTKIDKEILDNIKQQIKKERITLEQLTTDKTKQILKNLGYNKYYEHIPFIKEKLGIKPPILSIRLENKLCSLFMEIQRPYAKFCPDDRVNFLNYYFVLYKLLELLGEDEYLCHLYMLKDPVKRMEQDEIWKLICEELNWEFIPTL